MRREKKLKTSSPLVPPGQSYSVGTARGSSRGL